MNGFGGALQGDDGFVLDRPGAVAALRFLVELQNEKLLVEEPTAVLVTQLFNEGQAGMVINGPWFLGEVDPSIELGVYPLPVISETGEAAQPYLTVEALQVSAQTTHPEAAWTLARWLAAEPAALRACSRGTTERRDTVGL